MRECWFFRFLFFRRWMEYLNVKEAERKVCVCVCLAWRVRFGLCCVVFFFLLQLLLFGSEVK